MPLTNPGTPFDADGFADALTDIRKLYLMIQGGSNDMNAASTDVNQVNAQVKLIPVKVCVDGVQKTMMVMGTDPA